VQEGVVDRGVSLWPDCFVWDRGGPEETGKPAAWTGVGPVTAAAPAQFDAQINGVTNNNLMFLSLQTKVQSVSQTTQMISNIAKSDSDAKLNAVRNLRN